MTALLDVFAGENYNKLQQWKIANMYYNELFIILKESLYKRKSPNLIACVLIPSLFQ